MYIEKPIYPEKDSLGNKKEVKCIKLHKDNQISLI